MSEHTEMIVTAVIWTSFTLWDLYTKKTLMRWSYVSWEEEPAEFFALISFKLLVAIVVVLMAAGVT